MRRAWLGAWCVACVGAACAAGGLPRAAAQPGGLFAPGAPTLGGRFAWSDYVIYDDWRIQQSAVIGHYRLLDPRDRRVTFGEFTTCFDKLEETKKSLPLPPLPKQVVVVLHGLGAGRQFMQGLCDYLEDEGGCATVNFGYASTMGTIEQHARALDSVIRHLDGVERVDFVAHSMGNIVTRRYLHELSRLDSAARPPVKFGRMVMISPPNHGAEIADQVRNHDLEMVQTLAEIAAGEPLDELAPSQGWPELEKRLATPDFEFGIIAGGRADDAGYLPGIPGDDDGLLSIETHKLAGAADWVQTKGLHQLMPRYQQVREKTLSFLKNGYFDSAEARRPLTADKRTAAEQP